MPELVLKADVLAPKDEKTLNFSVHHPSKVIDVIPGLIREVFKLTGTNLFEDKLKWDTSASVTSFYGSWRGKDSKDARTTIWAKVKVQGKQSKDKSGSITILISGELITKLPYTNIFQKIIARAYSYMFYSERRRKYIEEARRRLDILENEMRRTFEIKGREI